MNQTPTTTRPPKTENQFTSAYKQWLDVQWDGEGAEVYKRFISRIKKALKPLAKMSPDIWADAYRFLTNSPQPGKWDSDYSAYLRQPSRDFIDDEVETIVLMFATQLGKTAYIENVIGCIIHLYPAPMYVVMPDEDIIKDLKEEKLGDMFESTSLFYDEGYIRRATPGSSETNARKIRFSGGFLAFASSNSMSALSGRTIRFLFMDEVDRMTLSLKEGDIVLLAKQRTKAYAGSRKIILTSTPTGTTTSRIFKAFKQGNQCEYLVPCPRCKHKQYLVWSNVEWEKTVVDGVTVHDAESAWYRCEKNGCRITHGDKPAFIPLGEWVSHATPKDKTVRSYHLNQLHAPEFTFAQMVAEYLEAKAVPGGLRTWFNTAMAQPYDEPTEQPQWEKLHARAEKYSRHRVPRGVALLTCAFDVQEGNANVEGQAARVEGSVWGWGRDQQRWLVDHVVIDGSYMDAETWRQVDDFRHQRYVTEDGRELDIRLTLVDSSAGNTSNYVYEYCRLNRNDKVMAVKGGNDPDGTHNPVSQLDTDSKGKKLKNSIKLLKPNVHQFKNWFYNSITEVLDPAAPYYVHIPEFVGPDVFKQLCAEKLVTKGMKKEYVATRANEALDCAVYCHSAAMLLGLDRTDWDTLFKQQGADIVKEVETPPETVEIVQIAALKRFRYNGNWVEEGEVIEVNEDDAARYCTNEDPFARRMGAKKVPLKEVEAKKTAQKAAKTPPRRAPAKSWFNH